MDEALVSRDRAKARLVSDASLNPPLSLLTHHRINQADMPRDSDQDAATTEEVELPRLSPDFLNRAAY